MERLSAWLQMHRWMAAAGFVAVLSVYILFAELIPRAATAYGLHRTWQQQQARIASVANWEVEQIQLSARKRLLQQRFATLYVSLPRSDHMSIILEVLQESADAEQVDPRQVRPTERVSFASYDELPFQVELHGTFHAIGAFINRMEQSPYVIKVKQLEMERSSTSPKTLVAELLLSVIILKEQGTGP